MDRKQTSILIRPGRSHEFKTLAEHPVVAIDLGFSKTAPSCGVAIWDGKRILSSGKVKFRQCVRTVCEFLEELPCAALIIEAPLCGMFDEQGNPVERGEFERVAEGSALTGTRYWYSGAGAIICLGAVFFLRELIADLESGDSICPKEILLYEGFVTFKMESTKHDVDAARLLNCVLSTPPSQLFEPSITKPDYSLITILDVVHGQRSENPSTAPVIIIP